MTHDRHATANGVQAVIITNSKLTSKKNNNSNCQSISNNVNKTNTSNISNNSGNTRSYQNSGWQKNTTVDNRVQNTATRRAWQRHKEEKGWKETEREKKHKQKREVEQNVQDTCLSVSLVTNYDWRMPCVVEWNVSCIRLGALYPQQLAAHLSAKSDCCKLLKGQILQQLSPPCKFW